MMRGAAGAAGVRGAVHGQGRGGTILAFVRRLGPTAARITDKLPFNFFWAGLIHLAFPNATIIHCRRRPIDTALSIHHTGFADTINMPTGGEALVGYYRGVEKMMTHWLPVFCPPHRFVELDYELLVKNSGTTEDPPPGRRRAPPLERRSPVSGTQ